MSLRNIIAVEFREGLLASSAQGPELTKRGVANLVLARLLNNSKGSSGSGRNLQVLFTILCCFNFTDLFKFLPTQHNVW